MKTPGCISFYLVLFCLACNSKTGLVDQSDLLSTASHNAATISSPIDLLLTRHDTCIAFTTTYWLNASGTYRADRTTASEEELGVSDLTGTYVIEASGDAISDIYARGRTEMQLILHQATQALSVEMTTHFYYGEELELMVDGVAEISSDGRSMQLRVAIGNARLHTGEAVYELDHGEITFNLPLTPEGVFTMQASAFMQVCL